MPTNATASRTRPSRPGRGGVAAARNIATVAVGERGQVDGLAQAGPAVADEDVLRTVLCIHFPHKLSQPMHDLLRHPCVVEILTAVDRPGREGDAVDAVCEGRG